MLEPGYFVMEGGLLQLIAAGIQEHRTDFSSALWPQRNHAFYGALGEETLFKAYSSLWDS